MCKDIFEYTKPKFHCKGFSFLVFFFFFLLLMEVWKFYIKLIILFNNYFWIFILDDLLHTRRLITKYNTYISIGIFKSLSLSLSLIFIYSHIYIYIYIVRIQDLSQTQNQLHLCRPINAKIKLCNLCGFIDKVILLSKQLLSLCHRIY